MAVGHKWVLVKNGEEASLREGRPNGVTLASKSSFSSQFMGTATELEALREALQQREEQVASCQATIQQLELTRDRLLTCSKVSQTLLGTCTCVCLKANSGALLGSDESENRRHCNNPCAILSVPLRVRKSSAMGRS